MTTLISGASKPAKQSLTIKTSKFFKDSHVSEIPIEPPNWLVYDLLEQNTVAQIFGDSGSHKSFIAIDLACCISSNKSYHGFDLKQSPVLYLAAEGQGGLRKRMYAWELENQIELKDYPINLPKQIVQFDDAESFGELKAEINQLFWPFAKEKYNLPDESSYVVFIDTLAKSMAGDDGSTQDINKFLNAADELNRDCNCTVVIIHHCGHTAKDRGRGAYALPAGIDANYKVTYDEKSGITTIIPKKMKEAELPDEISFTHKIVDLGIKDDRDRPVTSLVMVKNKSTKTQPSVWEEPKMKAVIEAMNQLGGYAKKQKEIILMYQKLDTNKNPLKEGAIKTAIKKAVEYNILEKIEAENKTITSYRLLEKD